MQYPKDEVRGRILAAALAEFGAKGYAGASMRCIAEGAKVALGNLYHYYAGKQALYAELVGPVYSRVIGELRAIEGIDVSELGRFTLDPAGADGAVDRAMEGILTLCSEHSAELSLLMNGSNGAGEPYGLARSDLEALISQVLQQKMLPVLRPDAADERTCNVLSASFMCGFCVILSLGEPGEAMVRRTAQLIDLMFRDITDRV